MPDDSLRWQVRRSDYLLRSPYVNLRQDECALPNGTIIDDYYVVEEPDYAVVFALTPAREVVMVRQYKHGIGEVMLELPAGFFDPGEEAQAAALREFREETGYAVDWAAVVGNHVRHPTRCTNRGHLLVATGARPISAQNLDANEAIEVVTLPLDEAFEKVRAGEIDAVGTVASLYMGRDMLTRMGRM